MNSTPQSILAAIAMLDGQAGHSSLAILAARLAAGAPKAEPGALIHLSLTLDLGAGKHIVARAIFPPLSVKPSALDQTTLPHFVFTDGVSGAFLGCLALKLAAKLSGICEAHIGRLCLPAQAARQLKASALVVQMV